MRGLVPGCKALDEPGREDSMTATVLETYDPRTFRARTFYDATPRFRDGTDTLFAPAVTMPLLSISDMPVGVQLMGQQHDDARLTAMARWLLRTVPPVVVG